MPAERANDAGPADHQPIAESPARHLASRDALPIVDHVAGDLMRAAPLGRAGPNRSAIVD
jgi:hypothetical protein